MLRWLLFPLSLALLVVGCASPSPSLMPKAQAVAINDRDRALALHADAIHAAIAQSGTMGALTFLGAGDGRPVILPGESPSDAWARYSASSDSGTARGSLPAVVTFVYRADLPKAPETVALRDLEEQQALRASVAALGTELRDAGGRIEERLGLVQRQLAEAMATTKQETDASVAAARAETQTALRSVAEDLAAIRKFVLQTAQLGWLSHDLTVENASGIRKVATASQELAATSARLEETMRQLSERLAAQLKELATRLDAIQGAVGSLK